MKVLSITEPYATLIRDGIKKIETRSWKTNYRGELLIHASSTRIPQRYRENEKLMSLVDLNNLHFGQIVCKCLLVDCIELTNEVINDIKENHPTEFICGFYEKGRYAWVLEDVQTVDSDKVKGSLGLWNCNENVFERRL